MKSMNTISIINKVKYSKVLYNLYFILGSWYISLLKLVVRKDNELILFVSFGGRKFDDSPKAIYEAMINDRRFEQYKLIWAFQDPDAHKLPRGSKIKIDTWRYFQTLLKARCWITNSSVERGLNISRINTYYFNSWHGTPIKLMGTDINCGNKAFGSKRVNNNIYDAFLAQGLYDAEIFKRVYNIPPDVMKIIGLPRNDELVNECGDDRVKRIKEKLGISSEKKVLLYAPTFREYTKDRNNNCLMAPPIDLNKWRGILGTDFILLFRAHYEVVEVLNIKGDDFVLDVSSYPDLNELMLVADILISDYSSIFFDYSVTHKPMICFAYDYEEYTHKRGLYFDIREWIPSVDNEDALLLLIRKQALTNISEDTIKFQKEFVTEFGHATKKALDIIYQGIIGRV